MYEHLGKVGIESGKARLEFDLESGTFDLHDGDTLFFTGATAGILIRLKRGSAPIVTGGSWQLDDAVDGALELFKLEDWGRAMPYVLTACHDPGHAMVMVLHGDGARHHLYLGARRLRGAP